MAAPGKGDLNAKENERLNFTEVKFKPYRGRIALDITLAPHQGCQFSNFGTIFGNFPKLLASLSKFYQKQTLTNLMPNEKSWEFLL